MSERQEPVGWMTEWQHEDGTWKRGGIGFEKGNPCEGLRYRPLYLAPEPVVEREPTLEQITILRDLITREAPTDDELREAVRAIAEVQRLRKAFAEYIRLSDEEMKNLCDLEGLEYYPNEKSPEEQVEAWLSQEGGE